jgi:hypothetical protein
MTLDAVIQAMSRGMASNYAGFKTVMGQMISEQLGANYVNLNSLLDVAYYKDAACTQEFKGTDTIEPDTVIYTKFSVETLMGGGGGGGDEADGYLAGTINFTGYTGQRPQIYIYAGYSEEGAWDVNDSGSGASVKSDGSFSMPLSEKFLTALRSKAQNITFDLWIEEPGSDGGYFKWGIKTLQVKANQLSEDNLNVGSLGTVNLPSALITLSATIAVTYNGKAVPYVNIAVYGNGGHGGLLGHIKTTSPSAGKTWKLILPAFESSTNLSFIVQGFSAGDWDGQLFAKGVEGVSVTAYKTDVTIPLINLGNITPSSSSETGTGGAGN